MSRRAPRHVCDSHADNISGWRITTSSSSCLSMNLKVDFPSALQAKEKSGKQFKLPVDSRAKNFCFSSAFVSVHGKVFFSSPKKTAAVRLLIAFIRSAWRSASLVSYRIFSCHWRRPKTLILLKNWQKRERRRRINKINLKRKFLSLRWSFLPYNTALRQMRSEIVKLENSLFVICEWNSYFATLWTSPWAS